MQAKRPGTPLDGRANKKPSRPADPRFALCAKYNLCRFCHGAYSATHRVSGPNGFLCPNPHYPATCACAACVEYRG
jgi:hypothetical protein